MPPADNTQPPAIPPAPVPEEPKKPGFFAKLFGGGKKPKEPEFPQRPSQTPPPELNDAADNGRSADPTATPAATPAPTDSTGQPVPPTLDVPPAVNSEEPTPPAAAPQEPAPGAFGVGTPAGDVPAPGAAPVEPPKEDTPEAPKA